jgi:hypothetical protein
MKGQQSIRLLYREVSSSRYGSHLCRQYSSKRTREPYVLSRLVIDLDAADSKFVKRVEDVETGQQEFTVERQESNRTEIPTKSVHHRPFNIWRITPHDLLSYAFLGDVHPEDPNHVELRNVARHNDILPIDSLETKIEQLISRYSPNSSSNLTHAGLDKTQYSEISTQMEHISVFWQLRRMIALLSSTPQGCKFIIKHENSLLFALQRTRGVKNEDSLLFLNNFIINTKAKSLKRGRSLWKEGYYKAISNRNLPSMEFYAGTFGRPYHDIRHATLIGYMMRQKGVEDVVIANEIRQLLCKVHGSHDLSIRNEIEAIHHKNNQIFINYAAFICILGRLGLKDELWSEWVSIEGKEVPPQMSEDEYRRFRAQMFGAAYLLAEDLHTAITILNSVSKGQNGGVVAATEHEEFPGDTSLLGLMRVHQTPISSRLGMFMFVKCFYISCQFLPQITMMSAIWDSLGEASKNPKRCIDVLQEFLLTGSTLSLETGMNRRFCAAIDQKRPNGQQGIHISNPMTGATFLWKPVNEVDSVV